VFVAPFAIGDLLLLAAAFLIFDQSRRPMTPYEIAGFGACVALGAWLGVWPFVLRHKAELKLVETATLADTLAQIQQLEQVAERIAHATGQWQTAHEHATLAVNAAREIADRMTSEQTSFRAFLEQATSTERSHLRLEVDKLRRAEAEWLQVAVRLLDHTYALFVAAVHSGQRGIIEQIGHFQNACRDVVRRVGLTPVMAEPGAPFDAKLHQLPDAKATVPAGALVAETLATGYAFQGQLIRPALVTLQAKVPPAEVNLVPSLPQAAAGTTAAEPDGTPTPEPTASAPTATPAASASRESPAGQTPAPAPTMEPSAGDPESNRAPSPARRNDEPPPPAGQPQLPF
jgi:molecular chaperone GrpE (heat shock protein)